LSSTSRWESHPKDKYKFEGVVKRKPVDGIHSTFKNGQEGIDNPVRQPLGVVCLVCAEERFQRVIPWDEEACKIDQEFSDNIEENQEKVDSDKPKERIHLRHRGLPFEVIEDFIFGKLLINLAYLVLRTILE